LPELKDSSITVIKRNISGVETWRYKGQIIHSEPSKIRIEAFFDRDAMDVSGLYLAPGDRFLETYYSNRWYNIFEIFSGNSRIRKGWYCNISKPAEFTESEISFVDLALDLVVFPDGQQLVLDKDEFDSLDIPEYLRRNAILALSDLQNKFEQIGWE
jgi:hypothetical protein